MDSISGLPDDLLIKILLLVPTKVAVSTSILSKRWEHLWMLFPKLEYGSRFCSELEWERLRCFLNRNMPLHRAPVIESFRLELCNSRFKPENIKMWVLAALSHCLRELEIEYEPYPANPDILPSSLYTCKSLVILKLVGDILLNVPGMVSLPCLKTLKLQWVIYFDDKTLQRLLSNCPILEDLVVELRDYGNAIEKLTVVVPSLQRLSLDIPCVSVISGYVIKTPALKYFKLRVRDYNHTSHYSLIEKMPNLIEAHLDVDSSSVIGSVTSVKRLSICSQSMFDEGLVLNQLERLEVCPCTMLSSNQFFRLLNASPHLKELDFSYMNCHDPHENMDYWKEPSTVPGCLLSSLQSLSWCEYTGQTEERHIVVYILKHALHLKTATIKAYASDVPKFEMLQELTLSSRASAACQLILEGASED